VVWVISRGLSCPVDLEQGAGVSVKLHPHLNMLCPGYNGVHVVKAGVQGYIAGHLSEIEHWLNFESDFSYNTQQANTNLCAMSALLKKLHVHV